MADPVLTTNPTTITAQPDFGFLRWVSATVLDENRPYNPSRPHLRIEGKQTAPILDFPIQGDPGASSSYTEGAGIANTQLTSTKASATAISYAMMATITKEDEENAIIGAVSQGAKVLGRSDAEKFEAIATAFYDDFATTVGTAGVPSTYSDGLAALTQLAANDQVGSPVFILDPTPVGNIQQDMGTTGAAAFANPSMDTSNKLTVRLNGDAGFGIGGYPVLQTSLVTSTGGGCFLSKLAVGVYEIRGKTLEMVYHPELQAWVVVVSSRYGMIEIRDLAGVTMLGA